VIKDSQRFAEVKITLVLRKTALGLLLRILGLSKKTHKTTAAEKADPANDKIVYKFPQPTASLETGEIVKEDFLKAPKGGCRVEKAFFDIEEGVKTTPHAWDELAP